MARKMRPMRYRREDGEECAAPLRRRRASHAAASCFASETRDASRLVSFREGGPALFRAVEMEWEADPAHV